MREYKFRAWNPLKKTMAIVRAFNWDRSGNLITCNLHTDKWYGGFYKDLDFILMQYTGLKDESGKEIYEGDVIKYYNDLDKIESGVALVKFEQCSFLLDWIDRNDLDSPMRHFQCSSELEIIGNIYENPELLD